ncbi:MAG: bifunctional hydroxymethylpyrimidine kinase/phosphomethylpyrimidine kinase, partial [Rhizobiaceae bacterium]|nr:bifunctional hydroxymethylpyrimidine kinase/phosphomethylpyrimidine kinase [Rhizobiaceae bacterium]
RRRGAALPIVLDPVLAASSGGLLLDEPGIDRLLQGLMLLATVTTPNIVELAALAGRLGGETGADVGARALALLAAGAPAVLAKGGHAEGPIAEDILFRQDSAPPVRFAAPRSAASLRGTGCALSTAIAVHLAAGRDLETACRLGKAHLSALFDAASSSTSNPSPEPCVGG